MSCYNQYKSIEMGYVEMGLNHYRREESYVSRTNQSINSSIKGDQMLHKKWGDGAPICQFRIYCTHIRSSEQFNNICKIIILLSMV